MNYDEAFFEMIKLRGEELFPLSLPYAWRSVRAAAAGIVLMDKENNYESMLWWLSWVRTDSPDPATIKAMTHAYHSRTYNAEKQIAANKHLEKMSGDDIVSLLATHFLFVEDLHHDK